MKSYVGIDWSKKKHDVQVLNEAGASMSQFQIKHSPTGFQELVGRLSRYSQKRSDCLIGIETGDNPVVESLRENGFTLYILSPNKVKQARASYRSAGGKDDTFDAQVIAELVRTRPGQFIRWRPDSTELQQIRLILSWLDDLTVERVQLLGRMHGLLHSHYPQIPAAFANLDGQVALAVLARYPSAVALQELTRPEFVEICRQQRFYGRQQIARYWRELQAAQPETSLQKTKMLQLTVQQMTQQMQLFKQQKKEMMTELARLFQQHPDADIFCSIPGIGPLLGPRLLAIYGEDRQRWPSAPMLAAVCGTVPVTKQSGGWHHVHFRRACNRRHRQTWQLFARSSLQQADWAMDYFQEALARGHRPSQAYRMVANRWVRIIWTMWQRRIPYDETVHLANIQKKRRPQK